MHKQKARRDFKNNKSLSLKSTNYQDASSWNEDQTNKFPGAGHMHALQVKVSNLKSY